MSEIQDFFKIDGKNVVICTYYDGDFMAARSISVFDERNNVTKITKFSMTRTTQCFNSNPVSPVFMINEEIDERFLKRGNRVELAL